MVFFRSEISYEGSAFNVVLRLGRVQALKHISIEKSLLCQKGFVSYPCLNLRRTLSAYKTG